MVMNNIFTSKSSYKQGAPLELNGLGKKIIMLMGLNKSQINTRFFVLLKN